MKIPNFLLPKIPQIKYPRDFKRGIERIRTAVAAFAELSLATRPRYLVLLRVGKGNDVSLFSKQFLKDYLSTLIKHTMRNSTNKGTNFKIHFTDKK
jgi:hypothetical protein